MKKIIFRILIYLQLHKVMRILSRKKIIILTYHGFINKKNNKSIENYLGLHINIEIFREQLEYLAKYYNIISLNELIEFNVQEKKIKNNSVVITIDDGYKSNFEHAFQELKKLNIPATIFLTSDFIENKIFLWVDRLEYAINFTKQNELKIILNSENFFFHLNKKFNKIKCIKKLKSILKLMPRHEIERAVSDIENYLNQKLLINNIVPEIYLPLEWNEINEMIKSGLVSIGSHTNTHTILRKCNYKVANEELELSKKIIENATRRDINLFSYPNGQIGDFTKQTKKLLQEHGYSCGLTTVPGMNNANSDIFELKRFSTSSKACLDEFKMILSGVSGYLNIFK